MPKDVFLNDEDDITIILYMLCMMNIVSHHSLGNFSDNGRPIYEFTTYQYYV